MNFNTCSSDSCKNSIVLTGSWAHDASIWIRHYNTLNYCTWCRQMNSNRFQNLLKTLLYIPFQSVRNLCVQLIISSVSASKALDVLSFSHSKTIAIRTGRRSYGSKNSLLTLYTYTTDDVRVASESNSKKNKRESFCVMKM